MSRGRGRGLMTAGAIVSLVGIGIVLVKAVGIPRYWLPLLVGLALFLVGALVWATGKHD